MPGAFNMLRSQRPALATCDNGLSIGWPEKLDELMSWNEDAARMPYYMHLQRHHQMSLNNDLAEGRYSAGDGLGAIAALWRQANKDLTPRGLG
jgi:polyhydroxyalkanoate synthase